jgi:hypothetical protein
MYSVVKYQGKELPIKIRTLILANAATYKSSVFGGDDRNRTCDPLNANQVLSQLSYIPVSEKLVAGTGFEPVTFGL